MIRRYRACSAQKRPAFVKNCRSDKTSPSVSGYVRRLGVVKTHYSVSFRRVVMVCATAVMLTRALLPAQTDPEDRPERAAARIEQLTQRLKLTPDQVERARPVLEREAQQLRDALRDVDRQSASLREKRKMAREVKSIRDNADKQLKGILTPAQMDELKRIREERRQQMKERRGAGA